MLRRAWLAGPLHVRVGMTELMLRRADAARVGLEVGLEAGLDPWPVAA
jgi:Fe2+ transport system protein FeoA